MTGDQNFFCTTLQHILAQYKRYFIAKKYKNTHKKEEFVLSTLTLLEIWNTSERKDEVQWMSLAVVGDRDDIRLHVVE